MKPIIISLLKIIRNLLGLMAIIGAAQVVSAQGIIVLEKQTPAIAVNVTATQQVILKPGFHAVGSSGSFDARIGVSNSVYPLIPIAAGSSISTGPSTGQNYVKTSTYLLPSDDSPTLTSVQYFDGLGRPSQTVAMGVTPTGADLVSWTQYDGFGRDWKKWLSTAVGGNFGQYVDAGILTNSTNNLYASDSVPFVETLLESSPMNRVLGQRGAGQTWDGHSTTVDYQTNDGTIAYYFVNSSNQLAKGANYNAGTLFVTQTTDEDGKRVSEYKDKLGQVVMKQSSGERVQTYYVYDDLGQLSYVLPPLAADALTGSTFNDDEPVLKQYAYLYKYDTRGNNIIKRLPGCDPINLVYDLAKRLILSQDGNQQTKNQNNKKQWTVTKYDAFGRVIFTGTTYIDSLKTVQSLGTDYSTQLITENYTNGTGYSTQYFADAIPLTVNYYDSYDFIGRLPNNNDKTNLVYDSNQEQQGYDKQFASANGLLTGTLAYILDKVGTNYLTTVDYYDDKGRVVQTRASNHLGGYDNVYNHYDFIGKMLSSRKEHTTNVQPLLTEVYAHTYDNAERLLTTTYTYNGGTPVLLQNNSYDELGRMTTKLRHNNTDTLTYAYNIRNWATMLKNGSFIENLYYNALPQGILNTPCFNGNIAFSTWTYLGGTNKYGYTYDDLNRLTANTSYDNYNMPNPWNTESFVYDKMGNITYLGRIGATGPIDELTLSYNGNQLKKVDDRFSSQNLYNVKEYNNKANLDTEFKYDVNGNMVEDLDRDIVTIKYNLLNLPDTIQFKNGNQIINKYDAAGQKLQADYYTHISEITPIDPGAICQLTNNLAIFNLSSTIYVDNKEYSGFNHSATPFVIDKIYNSEGYVSNLNVPPAPPIYYYYRKDHLGNNREVWSAAYTTSTKVSMPDSTLQLTQYYPSGLPWASNTNDNPSLQARKYNGKEFIEMSGLDTYDYGARGYYAASGRFTSIDPHAEKYYSISPYSYCAGNPINRIDIDGRDIIILKNPEGAHGAGHAAVLIGNEKNGWTLYSKNGTLDHSGLWGRNNKGNNENGNNTFKTLYDFANSYHNNDGKGNFEYTSAYRIKSSKDNSMKAAASKQVSKDYKLIGASCIDVVSDALRAGGLYDGGSDWIPNERYENIVNGNNGTDISEEINKNSGGFDSYWDDANDDQADNQSKNQSNNNNSDNSDNSGKPDLSAPSPTGSQLSSFDKVWQDMKTW